MKRKILSILTFVLVAVCSAFLFIGCDKETNAGVKKATVLEKSEVLLVIRVDEIEGEPVLYDVLTFLQNEGEISFVCSDSTYGKSLDAINGKASEGTYYWASYLSDETQAAGNSFSWNGNEYPYAMAGVSSLKVKEEGVYIFHYESWQTEA